MILNIGDKKKVTDPTDEQIRAALESFTAKDVRDSAAFVILETGQMSYIQASGEKTIGFDLEYQEGDLKHHFRAKRNDYTIDDILSVLTAYRDGKPDWKSKAEWVKLSL